MQLRTLSLQQEANNEEWSLKGGETLATVPPTMDTLLKEFVDVVQEDIPVGLPQERGVSHNVVPNRIVSSTHMCTPITK